MTDDNVTPIVDSHVCASCKATISTRNVYEGHTDACMQPEVRIRRLEALMVDLTEIYQDAAAYAFALADRVTRLEKETHGSSEEPITVRSGAELGATHYCKGGIYAYNGCPECEAACSANLSRSDAIPAEPACETPAGTVPAREEPG